MNIQTMKNYFLYSFFKCYIKTILKIYLASSVSKNSIFIQDELKGWAPNILMDLGQALGEVEYFFI